MRRVDDWVWPGGVVVVEVRDGERGGPSWAYDTADRVDTSGYAYDSLGRTTTVPASDTGNPGGGDVTATHTVDVNGERVRSWDDSDGSSTTTRTHHYSGDDDSPDWTDESGSTWTRTIAGLNNLATITTTYGSAPNNAVRTHPPACCLWAYASTTRRSDDSSKPTQSTEEAATYMIMRVLTE